MSLDAIATQIQREELHHEAEVAAGMFRHITTTPVPLRVQRAVVSLVSALQDSLTVDETAIDVLPSRAYIVAMLSDNDSASFASLRTRQVALLEVTSQLSRMSTEQFDAIDVAAHLTLADTLARYTTAWARFYVLVNEGLATNVDLEMIEATLGDVLSVASIGYEFRMTNIADNESSPTQIYSNAIQDLASLQTPTDVVATKEYGQRFASGLREFIEMQLGLSLSDAFLMVWISVDFVDAQLPRYAHQSVLNMGAGALIRWMDMAPTSMGFVDAVQSALAPYSAMKWVVGSSLASATRFLFSSPIMSSLGLSDTSDATLLFSLPLWQLLVTVRLVALALDRQRHRTDRRAAVARRPEVTRAFLERRRQLTMKSDANVAITSADFGSSDDETSPYAVETTQT